MHGNSVADAGCPDKAWLKGGKMGMQNQRKRPGTFPTLLSYNT
jgi:hypothetical protein